MLDTTSSVALTFRLFLHAWVVWVVPQRYSCVLVPFHQRPVFGAGATLLTVQVIEYMVGDEDESSGAEEVEETGYRWGLMEREWSMKPRKRPGPSEAERKQKLVCLK